jgi:hypothetical protein
MHQRLGTIHPGLHESRVWRTALLVKDGIVVVHLLQPRLRNTDLACRQDCQHKQDAWALCAADLHDGWFWQALPQ